MPGEHDHARRETCKRLAGCPGDRARLDERPRGHARGDASVAACRKGVRDAQEVVRRGKRSLAEQDLACMVDPCEEIVRIADGEQQVLGRVRVRDIARLVQVAHEHGPAVA